MRRAFVTLMTLTISICSAMPTLAAVSLRQSQSAGKPNAQAAAVPAKAADKKEADCGCETKAPPDVLATVNGVNVMIKDVDEPIKDRVQELQNQVIEARKHQVEVEINARLLDAEAA